MSKSIGLALFLEGNYRFSLFYLVFEGNFQVQVLGGGGRGREGLIFGGAFQRRVFCVTILSGLYFKGLIHGGAYFRNFMVLLIVTPLRRLSQIKEAAILNKSRP